MKTAADYTQEIIARAQQMRSYKVRLRVDDGWLPMGRVPFDIHIKNGVATLTVVAESMASAREQASIYMESDDWCE
jgi:hypothetical protein